MTKCWYCGAIIHQLDDGHAGRCANEKRNPLTDADKLALAAESNTAESFVRLPDAGVMFLNRGHDYGDIEYEDAK